MKPSHEFLTDPLIHYDIIKTISLGRHIRSQTPKVSSTYQSMNNVRVIELVRE